MLLNLGRTQEWQERKAGCLPWTSVKFTPSCWCTTQNSLFSPGNIHYAVLWKSISISKQAISRGDILAALLSTVSPAILHAWHKLNKVSLHSIDFSLESLPHVLDSNEGKKNQKTSGNKAGQIEAKHNLWCFTSYVIWMLTAWCLWVMPHKGN